MKRRWIIFWALVFLTFYSYVLYRASGHIETVNLPLYLIASLYRLWLAYAICLVFGITIGIFAAMNKKAGDVIIPLLDILQSVPVLGFFPFAILIIVPVFGFAPASIVLLFTSMAWSIVFGVIAGVKAIPQHIHDMAAVFGLRGWPYTKSIILPSIYPSMIAGSILAFGSGWYFLIASEHVTYGAKTYTLSGLGYYLNIASFRYGDIWMSLAGLLTISLVVFCSYVFLWSKIDKNAREQKFLHLHFGYEKGIEFAKSAASKRVHFKHRHSLQWFFNVFRFSPATYATILIILAIMGVWFAIMSGQTLLVSPLDILVLIARSFVRILIAYLLAVCLAIFLGFAMIKNPKVRKAVTPVADVLQSIPALAYFPLLFLILHAFLSIGLTLELSCILLLMTCMFWYLLFNIIEAAQHIHEEITEVARLYHIKNFTYVKDVLIPALFPAIITGSILAFGGGWNAVIIAEYVNLGGTLYSIPGIGSALNTVAALEANVPTLLFMLFGMTSIVLVLNHFVWRKLLNYASKYTLEDS